MNSLAKISCVCVTQNRPVFLREAINYFLSQDYPNKELIVVTDGNDPGVAEVKGENVYLFITNRENMTLGERRNYAIACATGDYIAQWDDDDRYHPQRLSRQIEGLNGLSGCVLRRILVFDSVKNQQYISPPYLWEGTILVNKKSIERHLYPSLNRAEDTPVVEALFNEGALRVIDAPELYTYVYHGGNTWDFRHFQNIFVTGVKI